MSKDEIIAFLRENLEIKISMDMNDHFSSVLVRTEVKIMLGDEMITEDYDYVDLKKGS